MILDRGFVVIGREELNKIADIARDDIRNNPVPENLDAAQFNIYNILKALSWFIDSQDLYVPFELDVETNYEE